MPIFRRPPPEFRPVLARYVAGVLVVLGVTVAAGALAGPLSAAIAAFVTVTPALALPERSFARAAGRARARLA